MNAIPRKIWQKLQSAVADLSDEGPPRKILEVILRWIRLNYKYLADKPFSIYGFHGLLKIDEEAMPVEFSSFKSSDVINFKRVIQSRRARDVEAIARYLRDTVEELATIEIPQRCLKCGSDGMRIFAGRYNGFLAFQCGVCGYAYYSDGSRVEAGGLEFASEELLRNLGLIQLKKNIEIGQG